MVRFTYVASAAPEREDEMKHTITAIHLAKDKQISHQQQQRNGLSVHF